MSKVVLTLAATSVGLGLVSLHLVKQLREGDATIADLKTQVNSLQEQITAARTITPPPASEVVNPFSSPPDAAAAPSVEAKTRADSTRNARQADPPAGQLIMAAAPPPVTNEDRARMMREHRERQRKLMQDPDYREAVRLQARTTYSRQYPGVTEELGFDPTQAEEFFAMLAEQQLRVDEQMQPLWDEMPNDPASAQARHENVQKAAAELQRSNEAEIAERFGADKLQAWKEYQSTLGQRWQLEQMRATLASQGLPLSPEVSKPMLKAMTNVQKQEMQEAIATNRIAPKAASLVTNWSFNGGDMEQQLENTRKRNQRMLDAISSYLTFEQRQALEREQQAQLKMQEAQMRMMRAQGNAGSSVFFEFGSAAAIPVQEAK